MVIILDIKSYIRKLMVDAVIAGMMRLGIQKDFVSITLEKAKIYR